MTIALRPSSALALLAPAIALLAVAGCVERRLLLESNPPGALVFLNGQEVARTPAEVPIEWYGRYDVAVRMEGFETLKEERWVVAPWWQWTPLDLVAELLPVRLTHSPVMRFDLVPATPSDGGLVGRAQSLREATTRPANPAAE